MAQTKTGKWTSPWHQIFRSTVGQIVELVTLKRYKAQIEHHDLDGQYLVLYNHQTPYDQFIVEFSFKQHLYFLATEDIFSNGLSSKIISFCLKPIPIAKSTIDVGSLKTCLKVVKEGGSLAIAPEGNRSYSGRTEYINPSIASLAKKLALPILLFKIEGGYGAEPRWAKGPREGNVRAYVSRKISKEELDALSKEELYQEIVKGLEVNENVPGIYKSDERAEYIERMIYACPDCGFAEFESKANEFHCKNCGRKVIYGEDKQLAPVDWDIPFKYAADWYDFQNEFVNKTDVTKLTEDPIFIDEISIYNVELRKRKQILYENVKSKLYGNRIEIEKDGQNILVMNFDDVSGIAALGKNKINVYHNKLTYQFADNERFNALKYVNIYTRYSNIARGKSDDKFLGL